MLRMMMQSGRTLNVEHQLDVDIQSFRCADSVDSAQSARADLCASLLGFCFRQGIPNSSSKPRCSARVRTSAATRSARKPKPGAYPAPQQKLIRLFLVSRRDSQRVTITIQKVLYRRRAPRRAGAVAAEVEPGFVPSAQHRGLYVQLPQLPLGSVQPRPCHPKGRHRQGRRTPNQVRWV